MSEDYFQCTACEAVVDLETPCGCERGYYTSVEPTGEQVHCATCKAFHPAGECWPKPTKGDVRTITSLNDGVTVTLEGRKDDSGKSWRPGLVAVEFIKGIATVLAFGAIKYAPGNWAKGMDWSRPIDALDRHWTSWKGGEKYDEETGYSHLWHAGCCLMFLVAYEARGIGRDDRAEVGMMAQQKEAA